MAEQQLSDFGLIYAAYGFLGENLSKSSIHHVNKMLHAVDHYKLLDLSLLAKVCHQNMAELMRIFAHYLPLYQTKFTTLFVSKTEIEEKSSHHHSSVVFKFGSV